MKRAVVWMSLLAAGAIAQPAPRIDTSPSLPNGRVGQLYRQIISVQNGTPPYAWSVIEGSLPPELLLEPLTGAIAGIPTLAGEYSFRLRVTDARGEARERTFRIQVEATTPAPPASPLTVETNSLPLATVGATYSQSLTASGGSPPYNWALASGSLPPAVTLNSSTGVLSGTPTAAGSFSFSVRVTDARSAAASKSLSLTVQARPLAVTTSSLASGQVGQQYGQTLAATGGTGAYTWSITSGSLPEGLTLNATTGAITGTPAASGNFDITVRVRDAANTAATQSLRISIAPAPLVITSTSLPGGQAGQPYTAALTASGGKSPYRWTTASGTLPAGLVLSASGAITGTPTTAGTSDFSVRVRDADNQSATQALRIVISAAPVPALTITSAGLPAATVLQPYTHTLSATGGTQPYAWSIATGNLPEGLALAPSGLISGTPASAGDFEFTARVNDSANRSATAPLRIAVAAPATPPLAITTSALAPGAVGQPYAQSLTAAGGNGPYTWSIQSGALPAGLALNPSGTISGTPSAAGDFDFTVRVADASGGSATRALRVRIAAAAAPPLTITTSALPAGNTGQAYSFNLSGSGGTPPYNWAHEGGILPAGLALSSPGTISGTPTSAGNFDFSVRLTDATNATMVKPLRVTISPAGAPLSITSDALPRATAGQMYTTNLAASGGTGPYTWVIAGGSLPAGVALSSPGAISGVPAAAGEFDFIVRVTDAANGSTDRPLRLSVGPALTSVTISTTALPGTTTGTEYVQALSAAGGRAPYVWSVVSGSLPPGLSLEGQSGRIAGSPLVAGSYTFTTRVTDADSRTAERVFTILVAGNLSISCPTPTAAAGSPYTGGLTATAGRPPYFWSVTSGQLPPGVTLNASAGALSGTPSTSGNYAFTVTVSDAAGGTANRSCSIYVEAPLEILTDTAPDATTRATYLHRLRSQGGSAPFVWSVASGTLPPGLTLDAATGAIAGQPTQPGRFSFGLQLSDAAGRQAQRTLSITVVTGLTIPSCPTGNTAVGQMFSSALVAVGGVTPYAWTIGSGSLPQGLSLTSETGLISGRATQPGPAQFSVSVTDASGGSATRSCSITVAPEFRLLTNSVAGARLRTAYSQSLQAEGGAGPYIWTLTDGALPPGLTLNSASGEITGSPAVAGTFRFTVRAADASGLEVDRALEIVVAAGLSITACPAPVAVADEVYSSGLSVGEAQGAVVWALASGTLPAGLSLSPSAGTLSGVPTTPGVYEFSVRATDTSSDSAARSCSISVTAAALRILGPETLTDAVLGGVYDVPIQAAGGRAPYQWTVIDGRLPAGLTLDPDGILRGTPTEVGAYQFTLQVADQDRGSAMRSFALRVLAGSLPRVRFSEMPEIIAPAQQPRLRLTLDAAYPTDLRGVVTLRFQPDPGLVDDPSIRFVTGSRSATFSVPANSTDLVFAVPELALQTGSVAGTIEVSVRLFADDADVTPNPAPSRTMRVDRTAPVISSVRINQTGAGFEVVIVGISPTRDVTAATFQFTPAPGSRLDASQVSVSTEDAARRWFQEGRSAEFGGQFSFVQPFSVQGASLSEVSVTLTNGQGTSQPARVRF